MQRDLNPDRLDDGAQAEAEMKERETPSTLAESITEYWGERCPDFDPDCHCCKTWKLYDDYCTQSERIAALEVENTALKLGLDEWQTDAANLAGAASAAESLLAEAREALEVARRSMPLNIGASPHVRAAHAVVDATLSRLKPGEKGGGDGDL